MKSKNLVDLIGHMGASPVCKYTSNGQLYAYFSLATSKRFKDSATGDTVERTEWHNIVSYGRLAEILRDYTKKGSAVNIIGELRTRLIPTTDGTKRSTTEIVAQDVNLLDKRPDTQNKESNPEPPQTLAEPVPEPENDPAAIPF